AIFWIKVDLPVPVFPRMYMWPERFLSLIPKHLLTSRKSVIANGVIPFSLPVFLLILSAYHPGYAGQDGKSCPQGKHSTVRYGLRFPSIQPSLLAFPPLVR